MADDGWVRIPPPTYRQRLLIGGLGSLLITWLSFNPLGFLGRRIEEALGGGMLTVIASAAIGVVAVQALVILVITRTTPALHVDARRGLLRLRGRERPLTDLVAARVEAAELVPGSRYDPPRRCARKRPQHDPVTLRLDLAGGGRFRIVLAIGPTTTITPERAAALIQAVRGSRITAPTASYDPDGRFTHLNFPGSLDIDGAVRLLEDPQRARTPPR